MCKLVAGASVNSSYARRTEVQLTPVFVSMTATEDEVLPVQNQRVPVRRRRLPHLSPWERSSSDPALSPDKDGPSSRLITGPRYARRQMPPQDQFRSSIVPSGDLEFRPEYREVFVAHPIDACATSTPHRRRRRARRVTVEGAPSSPQTYQATDIIEIDGTSQYVGEYSASYNEYPNQSTVVSRPPREILQTEGDISQETESSTEYVAPSLEERVRLLRQSTTLHLEGEQYFCPEYTACFVDSPRKRPTAPPRPVSSLQVEGDFAGESEVRSQYVQYCVAKRAAFKRQQTQLHLEGDMEIYPEYRTAYIEFPRQRPVLTRPRENIELPVGVTGVSEQRDQFAMVNGTPRPSLSRRPTTLRLDSELSNDARDALRRPRPATVHVDLFQPGADLMTSKPEYQESFKDFPRQRPETNRPAGSLTPEGPWLGRCPEYRSAFVDFPRMDDRGYGNNARPGAGLIEKSPEYSVFQRKRPVAKKPPGTLKSDGQVMDTSPEYSEKFKDFPRHRPEVPKPIENLKPEGELMATSPEYAEQFKNFPRQRPEVKKPTETLKPEGEMLEVNAEYMEKYKDSPRQRPKVIKPSGTLKPEGKIMENNAEYKESFKNFPRHRPDVPKGTCTLKPEGEMMEKSPEYKDSFKDFPRQRPRVKKPAESLRPEGEMMEKQPEYRDSYIDFPRHRPEVPRPAGSLNTEGVWPGRFPEYRGTFIDLPRYRSPKVAPVTPEVTEAYVPSFNGRAARRPRSAGSPRSGSPAPAGLPSYGATNKTSSRSSSPSQRSKSPRPDSRSGGGGGGGAKGGKKSSSPRPPTSPSSIPVPTASVPTVLVSPPNYESFKAFQVIEPAFPSEAPERQVTFDVSRPMTPRSQRTSRVAPAAVSAFKVLDPVPSNHPAGRSRMLDVPRGKGRSPGGGEFGSGWLTNPSSV